METKNLIISSIQNTEVNSMQDLDIFINLSPNAIIIINKQNIIIKNNSLADKIFGFISPNTLINNDLNIIIPNNFKEAHHSYVNQYFKNPYKRIGRIFNGLQFNGTQIPIEVSLSPVNIDNELYVIAIIREVRERKQMELFDIIFNTVADGIIIIDADGKIQNINNKILDMFEYKREELLLKKVEVLMPEKFRENHVKLREHFQINNQSRLPGKYFEAQKKSGNTFFVDISLSNIKIDQSLAIIVIIRDVSERRKFELELINTKNQAITALEAKSIFLSNMSHEIRTPLTGIVGLLNILSDTILNEEQINYIDTIKSCTNSLCNIINDILDLSKINAGKIKIYPTTQDFITKIKQLHNLIFVLLEKKNITITELLLNNEENIFIHIDFQRLEQIILNLISNSIKFTNEGGFINIIYEVIKNNNLLKITIKDTGIGIKEIKKKDLFQMFSRVHEQDNIYKGTGLGLVITKNLIELMKGTIKYESTFGIGTTFFITLPFENPQPINIKNNKSTDFSELKVLIVEDNKINQSIVIKYLNKINIHYIDVANNGVEAITLISNNNKYNIIFMDIHMPILNGYDTTIQLRKSFITIPIIAMTASIFDEDIQKCIQSGMNDHLSKPFNLSDLENILNKWYS
jgi:protein-histidine pros-kinase